MKPTLFNPKTKRTQITIEVKQTLQLRGLQLDQEAIQKLIETQKLACERYEMVEFETRPINYLIQTFMYSPYITQDRFLNVLIDAVYSYYAIQSRKTVCCYDDEVIQTMYCMYLLHHGVFTISYVQDVIKQLEDSSWDK